MIFFNVFFVFYSRVSSLCSLFKKRLIDTPNAAGFMILHDTFQTKDLLAPWPAVPKYVKGD